MEYRFDVKVNTDGDFGYANYEMYENMTYYFNDLDSAYNFFVDHVENLVKTFRSNRYQRIKEWYENLLSELNYKDIGKVYICHGFGNPEVFYEISSVEKVAIDNGYYYKEVEDGSEYVIFYM